MTAPRDAARRAAASEEEFLEVIRTELPRLQRLALALADTRSGAEELVAEMVARTYPQWRGGHVRDLPAYMRRVLVSRASRGWKRRVLARRRDHAALQWTQPTGDPAGEVVERDRTLRAVADLAVRRRAVVLLRFYDDLSEARIAEVLGISVGTVKSQLARALGQLRVTLNDEEQR
ncbi:MAG: sigma factor-like helix-turn-helix DNA-binding protein [Ilumatobacteraceae bacterium]